MLDNAVSNVLLNDLDFFPFEGGIAKQFPSSAKTASYNANKYVYL